MPKRGEKRPMKFSWQGPYAGPSYLRSWYGAIRAAMQVARLAKSRGYDDKCIVTDRRTGQTWELTSATDTRALKGPTS